jgi:CDP-6-deoxy-D-xylo-4-hexulose-3-dehydrase
MTDLLQLKKEILKLTAQYTELELENSKPFSEGDRIPYASRVYDKNERLNLVESVLTFWLTAGEFSERFERKLKEYLDVTYAYAVNSGSSANLLALIALMSPLLKEKRIHKGDEIITVAAAFPTTVAPIVQAGCVPVFVDIAIPSYNIDVNLIDGALSKKTKAVFLAHSLGNTFNLKAVLRFCDKHGLYLIEDNCDSLGALYDIGGGYEKTGTFGHIGTSSFYPAHHLTMGEGGGVYTKDPLLAKIMLSLRDWGRDCVCPPGVDDKCGKRFDGQFGNLPTGYDHKYVYSHFGYNLKITDMQAAVGVAQIEKLAGFVKKRRANWSALRSGLEPLADYLVLPEEEANSNNSPFGFVVTVKEDSPVSRDELAKTLENNGVQTRMFFAGNIVRHPCFLPLRAGVDYRISGSLEVTDRAMNRSLWVGVYPGLTSNHIDWMTSVCRKAFGQ